MALEIAQREREGIIILDLKGRITAGDEAGAFRGAVEKAAATPEPRLILNLQGVDYIDSTGLGAMVMCSTRLSRAGGRAKLLNLNRRSMELLVMTKIDTIFEAFDDEVDAVNSFFPGREIRKFDILSFVQQMKREPQGQ
jgi:anti-sigma B factor antagonist